MCTSLPRRPRRPWRAGAEGRGLVPSWEKTSGVLKPSKKSSPDRYRHLPSGGEACYACRAAGVWPHALFSGHSHNYQRYTRTVNNYSIPYLVAGCGGHSPLSPMRATYRTPYKIDSTLTLESYDDTDYGYLRVVVNATTMRVEFHPESDGGVAKTPDDAVTITLATHSVS